MAGNEHAAAPPEPPAGELPPKDACTMAMLAHLLALILGLIGPLLIWLLKKDDHPFIDDQGKESLNFQITIFIVLVVCGLLTCAGGIGIALLPIVYLVDVIFIIIASIKANQGEAYRYPLTLRLIK